jgi:hypothetical protein
MIDAREIDEAAIAYLEEALATGIARPDCVAFTIRGELASKANSRELVTIGPKDKRRTIFRKSDKALGFAHAAALQIPASARVRMEGKVRMYARIFYTVERPDLDESLLLDILQDHVAKDKATGVRYLVQAGVYRNDRQVRRRFVFHGIDRDNPRCEVLVETI